jgi:hypothetical protein
VPQDAFFNLYILPKNAKQYWAGMLPQAVRKEQNCHQPIVFAINVLAVCDVFAVAIKEREAFQQPQKCGGTKHHKGA